MRWTLKFESDAAEAASALQRTRSRLQDRQITDDLVTALCINALTCDMFEREIRDIPYLITFSDRVGVFIDEYQDFNPQQVFLMGFRAKRKYRQITVAGDTGQRLHADGVSNIATLFPYISGPVRQISLNTNYWQSNSLASFTLSFRGFTDGKCRNKSHAAHQSIFMIAGPNSPNLLRQKLVTCPMRLTCVVIKPKC